jgi:hypothetical protein
MSAGNYERTSPNGREVYIARTARILEAMRRASDNLVGTTVEVLPVGDDQSSPAIGAVERSGVVLYTLSGDEGLHPEVRAVDARTHMELHGGGVVRVKYDGEDDLEAQGHEFLRETVNNLLILAEGLYEGASEVGKTGIDPDLDAYLNRAFSRGVRSRDLLAEVRRAAASGGHQANLDTVAMLEWAIAQIEPARDALAARDEISMVNDVSLRR